MNDQMNNFAADNSYATQYTPCDLKVDKVYYSYVISLGIITFHRYTRLYAVHEERGKALCARILCILCNLTLGWWGFPWGPIYTVKETFCNLFNLHKVSYN